MDEKQVNTLAMEILSKVYFDNPSVATIEAVIEVLKDNDEHNKETVICDVLGIPRRGNRAEIRVLLEKYSA